MAKVHASVAKKRPVARRSKKASMVVKKKVASSTHASASPASLRSMQRFSALYGGALKSLAKR